MSATRPWTSGSCGSKLGQDTPETQRVFAERRPHPVVTGGRRVAFVEDEVDDLEHRRQTGGEFGAAGDLEGHARFGEGSLGADDSLGDGRLRDEKRARDLVGRQTPEQAQRERNARLGREHRVTGDEHEAQEVVADIIVDSGIEIRHGHLLRSRARDQVPRACAQAACFGGSDRWHDASRWP